MIYTRETVLLNETKESHQIVFLQNVYRSVPIFVFEENQM